MSTAPIRKALEALRREYESDQHGMSADEAACLEEALAAVEAIEKAAQDIAAWGDIRPASRDPEEREAVGQAEMLVRRIAQESMP